MLAWAFDEPSFDRFHSKSGNLYRVNAHFNYGESSNTWSVVPAPLTTFARQEVASIPGITRFMPRGRVNMITYNEVTHAEENNVAFVEPSFFRLFDFEITKGNRKNPFTDTRSLIVKPGE